MSWGEGLPLPLLAVSVLCLGGAVLWCARPPWSCAVARCCLSCAVLAVWLKAPVSQHWAAPCARQCWVAPASTAATPSASLPSPSSSLWGEGGRGAERGHGPPPGKCAARCSWPRGHHHHTHPCLTLRGATSPVLPQPKHVALRSSLPE